jgi:uncharacterized protein (UPF0548 family)
MVLAGESFPDAKAQVAAEVTCEPRTLLKTTHLDNSGISAQPTTGDGRSWTSCPLLRICECAPRASTCPLRARSAGQRRELAVTPGQPGTPARLHLGRLTRCANRPKQWVGRGSLVGHDQAMGLTVLPIEVRDRLAGAELTYREVGTTAGNLPAGYHQFTRSLPAGYGHELFVAAGDAVRQWQVQLGAGLQVSASSPTAVAGTVLLLGLGIGSLRLRAPCRVVYAVDEPRRRGFAYGTLAGHPESGEEAFMIEHHDDDSVSFTITAFSRPATRRARIAGPLGAVVQRQITAAYLRSRAKIVVQLACNQPG